MKILAVGAGSMGRRRLRDLTHLNQGNVLLYEPNAERCSKVAEAYGVRGFTEFDAALAERPDAMTISSPPALHEKYVHAAMERKLHVFAEVPFVLDLAMMSDVARQAPDYPRTIAISASPRFYPPFRLIYDLLRSGAAGKPLYCEFSLGNYLPDWHPYEDYRKFYGGDMRMGGAGLDMIPHEMNTIHWWLGPVDSVLARLTKLSDLEINGPDNHDVLLTFASGCRGFFHNDVIERGTQGRHIRIVGSQGTIEWHQNLPHVRFYEGQANRARDVPFAEANNWDEAVAASREVTQLMRKGRAQSGKLPSDPDTPFVYDSCYLCEMREFVDAAQGKRRYETATPEDELLTLRIYHAILRSSEQNREVALSEI